MSTFVRSCAERFRPSYTRLCQAMNRSTFPDRYDADLYSRAARLLFKPNGDNTNTLLARPGVRNQANLGLSESFLSENAWRKKDEQMAQTVIRMMAGGPKVLVATAEQCQAAEEVEVTIGPEEYSQPFPLFMVEYPREYLQMALKEVIPEEENRKKGFFGGFTAVWDLRADSNGKDSGLLCTTFLSEHANISNDGCQYAAVPQRYATPAAVEELGSWSKEFNSGNSACRFVWRLQRAAVNLCLMLQAFGHKQAGRDVTAEHWRRLETYLTKSRKSGNQKLVQQNQAEMASFPSIFSFAQDICIREAVGSSEAREYGEPTGRKMKPHWRRSHWRSQPYGPMMSLRRPKLIKHLFVNKNRFAGSEADTVYVASMPPAEKMKVSA